MLVAPAIKIIPLNQIEVDPENVRSTYDEAHVASLRDALETEGSFIHPPTVYAVSRGRYRVKHGNSRVLAAKGVADSLAVLISDPPTSPSAKTLAQLSE